MDEKIKRLMDLAIKLAEHELDIAAIRNGDKEGVPKAFPGEKLSDVEITYITEPTTWETKLFYHLAQLEADSIKLKAVEEELESLHSDPAKALELVQTVLRGRETQVSEARSVVQEHESYLNQLAQLIPSSEKNNGLQSSVAAVLALALTLSLAGGMLVHYEVQPPTLQMNFNIAEMVEAMLLGVSALIAALAYAFGRNRERDTD